MTEPEADADSPPPVDVTVTGGHFGHAVVGTQIVNSNTVVHQHGVDVDASALPTGHFRLNSKITVSEIDPISSVSRIFRAKLHSVVLGDLEIAVKILSDGERQRREAQIHFKVPHHINIVERILTDAFKYQGQSCIYIAMEQCDPQNLYAYVVSLVEKNAPYDSEMFMSFAFQIATGLEFLHRHKILNRDLKPENILLSTDKKIAKVADFGMSKEMTGEASTVSMSALQPGTNGWMSPEILKNVQRITPASDMFLLGLIFNFLWSYGKHAYGDDPHAWNLYIKRGTYMTLDGLKIPNANAAKRLLRSLLRQNPAQRPSALEVLRDCVFEGPRLQSDSAAIYSGITDGRVQGSAAIGSKGTPEPMQKRKSLFGKIWKSFDRKSAKDPEENVTYAGGAEETDATLRGPTENMITDIFNLRRKLERHDISFSQRIPLYFHFGIEWEGKYAQKNGPKVVVTQYYKDKWQNYENAVSALSDLEHENIVHFIKEVPEVFVIITEFHNVTLEEYLQGDGQQAELSDLLCMATQVATGMNFLHGKKYIHCDIRAGNVVVVANSVCKISGFSLARHAGLRTHVMAPLRSPLKWTAPEIFDKRRASFESDVWSFGVLLWEIVTRRLKPPYPGMRKDDVYAHIAQGYRMPKPEQCPSGLYCDIMMPCWEELPHARPAFAELEKHLLLYDVEADKETKETDENVSALDATTEETTNLGNVGRKLQRYGIRVQRSTDSYPYAEEYEGQFNGKKVIITHHENLDNYREAVDLLKDLNHPNIVDLIEELPLFNIIMTEFSECGTLLDYLRRDGKEAELSDLLRMAAQIASGMKFLNEKRFIHGALSARHVVIGTNSMCKISGFAAIGKLEPNTYELADRWKAPVRWTSPDGLSYGWLTSHDVWSFGVVLWEILTRGQTPYPGVKSCEVFYWVCSGHRMLQPKQCPSGLYFDIMRPCWDEDRCARPAFECLESYLLFAKAEEKEESMTVLALHDFTAVKEDELTFMKGDIIVDCTEYDNGARLQGTFDGQSAGYFPTNYVLQLMNEESTNLVDLRNNLQGCGIRVQRFARDVQFGKQWIGRFSNQKVSIVQFNEDDAEKYENAVGVLTDLKHENIVTSTKLVPELCVIVTEFGEMSLVKYLRGDGKRAKLNDLLHMAAQIARGMDFLHRQKYIHCYLRAANVIVGPKSLCKISGIRFARDVMMRSFFVLQSDYSSSPPVRWVAQEAFEGGHTTFKSDVWSFGVVLWEIVTRGQVTPYPGVSDKDVERSICGGHRMLQPKQCPSGLYFNIMMPCWNEDPDARPTFECLEKSLLPYDVEADEKEESVTVRALFDYTTVREWAELSFKKGDIIVDCTVPSDVVWSRGTLDGERGDFPTNYVVQIKSQGA